MFRGLRSRFWEGFVRVNVLCIITAGTRSLWVARLASVTFNDDLFQVTIPMSDEYAISYNPYVSQPSYRTPLPSNALPFPIQS